MKIKSYKAVLLSLTLTATTILTCSPGKMLFLDAESAYAATKKTKDDSVKKIKDALKKVLSLRVDGYEDMTLKEFGDFVAEQFENNHSIWRAKNRLAHIDFNVMGKYLTQEELHFLETTLPCTYSESDNPNDRSVAFQKFPATFGGSFDLYSKFRATTCHFEYSVRYMTDLTKTTVGERDSVVLKVEKGMKNFVEKTAIDPAKNEFAIKIDKKLDALLKKYATPEIKLEVFQYPGK